MGNMEQRPSEAQPVLVVVGHDFSEASAYALATAERLVSTASSSAVLHVVHATGVVAVPDAVAKVLPTLTSGVPPLTAVRERLESACAAFAQAKSLPVVPHLIAGDPAAAIAGLARELDADLIVVGTRRRKGVAIGWHRSLSARLVRLAPCSVLTARPKEHLEARIEPPCDACLAVRRESAGNVVWCATHTAHHVHAHLHHGDSQAFVSGSWTFRA
jgi:universal stress protein A